ncbi:deoxyhypusine synthase-like [Silene latifolia]|uniref:deoxyhypusine synthase-like n=1 Tax=Silene latifolia TaxID=37657 RepID=UPI003D77A28A
MVEDSMASTRAVVFKESENLEGKRPKIEGYDFNQGVNYSEFLNSFVSTGFQASNLGDAIQLVNQMLEWRLADEEPVNDCTEEEKDPSFRESTRCKLFLGFTSNLISSGVRDTVRYLVQHHMVSTTEHFSFFYFERLCYLQPIGMPCPIPFLFSK